jgi:CobQ-like glutamine amidotransferase family enzyme
MKTIKLEMLFGEVANLYGDPFNIRYLHQSIPKSELISTSLTDTPRFMTEDVDFIYMGPMPEYAQELALEKLIPCRDRIEELIEGGTVFLMTGNALELFGKAIETEEGRSIPCLGFFDTTARRKMMNRYNGLFLGTFEKTKIVGFKTQFSHSYGFGDDEGLFKRLGGDGLSPGAVYEGLRRNNFFATYLVGPLLVLNPEFTKYILELLGTDRDPAFYKDALKAYFKRLAEFERSGLQFVTD